MTHFNLADLKQSTSLDLLARHLVEGFITGLHKSPYHGFSVEFSEHRLYNEGESTRHIDWKVFSRTDRLYTKQYAEETNLRCMLVVDQSASMFYPRPEHTKIKFSIFAAAALAYLLQSQRDAVGLCTFSNQINLLTQVKSTSSHLNKVFTQLQECGVQVPVGVQASTSVAKVLDEIAEKIHKRSLVVVFSDFFDSAESLTDLFKALQHLRHNRHEVIVFHVSDRKTEERFEFGNKQTEFIDVETGEKLTVNPEDVQEIYQQKAKDFYKAVKQKCLQFKVDFVEADVSDGFQHILQSFLIKRAKMK
ncbi:MAG: DUF58 domain-containing protein [Cyclobacteriaceae bacterium]|jgi:uncharacterized protein (DUF58 family)|nr:DUF58 domain-containing protein [Flammeovirgaceae bacterium]MCZ8022896.1 DUF58 domain-containing protein [Cytophagales bacterium]MCZ8328203.1 DUF58 domain-containing protein [Cyclobacteriaceae bacterium]